MLTFGALAPAAGDSVKHPGASEPRAVILLGASYAASWGSPALPGWKLTNKGRAGEETSQLLARFDRDVLAEKPATLVIWGHINDIFRAPGGDMKAAAEKAKRNHAEMIRRASEAGIEVVLATEVTVSDSQGIVNWAKGVLRSLQGKQSYQERVNAQVRAVNDYLRAEAAKTGRLLLDFEKAFDDGNGFRRPEFSAEDGSHISPAGYQALTAYTTTQLQARARTTRSPATSTASP